MRLPSRAPTVVRQDARAPQRKDDRSDRHGRVTQGVQAPWPSPRMEGRFMDADEEFEPLPPDGGDEDDAVEM
jgi:hypothetical protein